MKDYPPDTGNIVESIYDGIDHNKKNVFKKKPRQRPIESVDDVDRKLQQSKKKKSN